MWELALTKQLHTWLSFTWTVILLTQECVLIKCNKYIKERKFFKYVKLNIPGLQSKIFKTLLIF